MSKAKPNPTPPAKPTPRADWRTDPHAQEMMTILVAAGVDMYRQRLKERKQASATTAVVAPPPAAPATTRRKPKSKNSDNGR